MTLLALRTRIARLISRRQFLQHRPHPLCLEWAFSPLLFRHHRFAEIKLRCLNSASVIPCMSGFQCLDTISSHSILFFCPISRSIVYMITGTGVVVAIAIPLQRYPLFELSVCVVCISIPSSLLFLLYYGPSIVHLAVRQGLDYLMSVPFLVLFSSFISSIRNVLEPDLGFVPARTATYMPNHLRIHGSQLPRIRRHGWLTGAYLFSFRYLAFHSMNEESGIPFASRSDIWGRGGALCFLFCFCLLLFTVDAFAWPVPWPLCFH